MNEQERLLAERVTDEIKITISKQIAELENLHVNLNRLRQQFDTSSIKNNLQKLPGDISAIKRKLGEKQGEHKNAQQLVAEAQQELEAVEAGLMIDISDEVDDKGKKKFSNDTARKGELQRRKTMDHEWAIASIAVKEAEQKVFEIEMESRQDRTEMKRLEDMFAATLAIAELTAAELIALAK